jgi:3-methyladenine DNA glycosylase Mpg
MVNAMDRKLTILKGTIMARVWTDEQKARQAALIRSWKPWTRSTGARTPEGKKISSMNVLVGNANRAAALAIAKEELKAVQATIRKLSRGREGFR